MNSMFQMICSRMTNPSPTLVKKISAILQDRFYVPVLRSEDNCIQPVIGEPFSPISPPVILHEYIIYIFT